MPVCPKCSSGMVWDAEDDEEVDYLCPNCGETVTVEKTPGTGLVWIEHDERQRKCPHRNAFGYCRHPQKSPASRYCTVLVERDECPLPYLRGEQDE